MPSDNDGRLDFEQCAASKGRKALVNVSQVAYGNSFRQDIATLANGLSVANPREL